MGERIGKKELFIDNRKEALHVTHRRKSWTSHVGDVIDVTNLPRRQPTSLYLFSKKLPLASQNLIETMTRRARCVDEKLEDNQIFKKKSDL